MTSPPPATATAEPTAKPRARRAAKAAAPTRPAPKPFGPGSAMWDEMGDVLFIVSSGGAFMLQAMHPQISGAVDEHSVFRTDPLGRAIRSTDSMMAWVYGGEGAVQEGQRLRELHQPVHGTDRQGRHYAALDSEAWAWVHATAYVTEMTTFPLLHGREATPQEAEERYEEFLQLGDILQVPAKVLPPTVKDYWDMYATVVNDQLERTVVAEELLFMYAHPGIKVAPGPFDPVGRGLSAFVGRATLALTLGGMTESARRVLGVTWTKRDQAQLEGFMRLVRPAYARLPERMRYVPLALHARRFQRELRRADRRQTKSLEL